MTEFAEASNLLTVDLPEEVCLGCLRCLRSVHLSFHFLFSDLHVCVFAFHMHAFIHYVTASCLSLCVLLSVWTQRVCVYRFICLSRCDPEVREFCFLIFINVSSESVFILQRSRQPAKRSSQHPDNLTQCWNWRLLHISVPLYSLSGAGWADSTTTI